MSLNNKELNYNKRQYIFGPVASRRLNLSLGIDLSPLKTCSMSCIYCEVGRTTTLSGERREWIPLEEVIGQLDNWLIRDGHADYLTISGSGEPTMHSRIGELILWIKNRTSIPIAVITNSAHLHIKEVRRALLPSNVVLPSLDAVDDKIFRRLNRPATGVTIKNILSGLTQLRREYSGQIWLEVLLCKGYNDSEIHLHHLAEEINKLNPNKIHINTVVRPGAEKSALASDWETLVHVRDILGPKAEIIVSPEHNKKRLEQSKNLMNQGEIKSLKQKILSLVYRRPCTREDIAIGLGVKLDTINDIIDKFLDGKQVKIKYIDNKSFIVKSGK